MLSLQAVQIEPEEVRYRINAAMVAMAQEDSDNALNILHAAKNIAKTPTDIAVVDQQINQIEGFKTQLDRFHKQVQDEQTARVHAVSEPPSEPEPEPYPAAPPTGPHHTARGVLRSVHCAYPTLLTLDIDQAGKPLSLYTNNYMKIVYTTSNFIPKGELDPCNAIEGMKARIEYTAVTDKRVAGQIVSIELTR
jgi:urocanate hydratase